ncbi:helix-turn-helix domain-containing protein [Thermodesulfobacteriota bacterium]
MDTLRSNKLLSVEELAAELNVPRSWVYSRTRQKGADAMPRITVGKYLRFRLKDVLNWLEKKYPQNESPI